MMGNSGLKQHYEMAAKTGVLQISDYKLKEMPAEVLTLSNVLRSLDLSKNKLTRLPDEITKMKNLKLLNIECNRLESLTGALGNVKKLEILNASNNVLWELPNSFPNLSYMKQIYLNNNNFSQFPVQVLGLKNLEVLELSHNKITVIPSGMSQLYAVELNLSQNEISFINEELHQAPRLKILRLEENCLSLESIKPSLLRDSKIHTMKMDGNLFELKQLACMEGYNEYIERYTAMKKKMF